MTPRQLRDAVNSPWPDVDVKPRCPHCKGLGRTYLLALGPLGPYHDWDDCAPCKGTGSLPNAVSQRIR